VDEKSLVIFDPTTNKYFTGFTTTFKAKWSKDVLKADKFPFECKNHFQIKMELKLLKSAHTQVQVRVFEHSVLVEPYDVGSIEDFLKKQTVNIDSF
jgi:hypothetical protein